MMRVLLDGAGIAVLELVTVSNDHGDRRRYYATSSGPRLLVVCRGDLVLTALAGAVVEAGVGWDRGYAGFVWRPGQRHSKLTIYSRAAAPARAEITLSALLAQAPQ